ncbi:KRAB-A domain-containing protein 2-like [Aphis craccivora]|uniref:KRAB-A domain-containing protein 2-like n=1 Tax=Aphis craccivora TaxID=307492 RepID=A0A6G0YA79_APHCR|nr:KRAB-A domain-containing protein 2-like [Aphis craccivora]
MSLCTDCHKKSSNPKRSLVSKPILHSAYNSRAQIDLIDMQSQSINNYRFIMNYQDHLTTSPAILYSDNGREFVNNVNELHT